MKKYLISLLASLIILSCTSMVVSCGTPLGNEIDIKWDNDSTGNNETDIDDDVLANNGILPVFNFINSTAQSRKESRTPNDGMTTDQINNTLESKQIDFENSTNKNIWKQFYPLWSSNEDNYFSQISVYDGKDGNITTMDAYDSSKHNISKDKVHVPQNVATAASFLDANFANSDDASNGHNAVYVNINGEDSSSKSAPSATFTFNFQKQFLFKVDVFNFVAELALVKLDNNSYQWFLAGYTFVYNDINKPLDSYYPTENILGCTVPFIFARTPNVNELTNINYQINPNSITQI